MSRLMKMAVALVAVLALSGCGETLEQRAGNRDDCENLGGTYGEVVDVVFGSYYSWNCDMTGAVQS